MTSTDPSTGTRPTRQRRAIAGVMEAFDDFRSAQEIHGLLSERGEQVGLSTVYRALQTMADAGELACQVRHLAALPARAVLADRGRERRHQPGPVVADRGEDEGGHARRLRDPLPTALGLG